MPVSSLPFLIMQLRPEDETADSEYDAIMRYGRLSDAEVERARLEENGLPEIDLDRYCAIIVGGSPYDVSKPGHEKSDIQVKIEAGFMSLFDRISDSDFPFLGACCGNGLLGMYCGTPISGKYAEPVSGTDVWLTEEGKSDPLLEGFPETFRVMLGHKEACDETPPGTTLLVTSEACPVQMFRMKSNIYATQFHPEGDAEGFIVRIHAYKDFGYFAPETAQEIIDAIKLEDTPYPKKILSRFVARYRRS